MNAIRQIGPLPKSAKFELRDINHDLCDIASKAGAKDPNQLRESALNALHKVEPAFGPLVATFIKPGDVTLEQYLEVIEKLPAFGHAGLPLIDSHLKLQGAVSAIYNDKMFLADVKLLAEVAKQGMETKSLQMLVDAPKSPLGLFIKKIAPDVYDELRRTVGKELLDVSTKKPQVRKKENKMVTDYFIEVLKLKSNTLKEDRLLACEALGSFGGDAVSALDELANLQNNDFFTEVREAARDAIKKIEEKGK